MSDIEATAERVERPSLPDPPTLDGWMTFEWIDKPTWTNGGFWSASILFQTREDALANLAGDPRRERLAHIVERKG